MTMIACTTLGCTQPPHREIVIPADALELLADWLYLPESDTNAHAYCKPCADLLTEVGYEPITQEATE